MLSGNAVTDLSPLADNIGIDLGDLVDLRRNPIDCQAQADNLAALRVRGVDVKVDCGMAL
jgi:hypothetical protein